jgi:diguanylate cyclase (GGDEF)-like protein/hemerythrin-like metal-binding protein
MQLIEIFPWNEHFNTGLDSIDVQHRRLVVLLNELVTHIAFGNATPSLDELLAALADYAQYHFGTEEALWNGTLPGSAETVAHRRSHARFIEFIDGMRRRSSHDATQAAEMLDFLVHWLAGHILQADRELAYVVLGVRDGLTRDEALRRARERMSGATQAMIQIILSTFEALTRNTLELMRELSRRRGAQTALANSQALLSAVVDSTASPIWSVDAADFALLTFNAAIRQHFAQQHHLELTRGMSPEQHFAHAPGYAEIWRAYYRRALTEGAYRVEYLTAYGGQTLQLNFSPIRRDGVVVGVAVFGEDISARKAAESQARFLALHDALTRLPNRELVAERFTVASSFAVRDGARVALLALDLDQFKAVNDALGHRTGDALLRAVAARLQTLLGVEDTLGRSGGDDFLLVLGKAGGAEQLAERAGTMLEALRAPFDVDGHALRITASIGVALYPDDGADFDTLLRQADTALFVAKSAGRDDVRFFDAAFNVVAVDALALRAELALALQRGEFELHYQPQIDLGSGTVLGAEALLRWRSPQRGLVAPGCFIGVAEDSGLIVPIGSWVLQQACRQAAAWRAAGLGDALSVGVNLSALQFRRGDLVATVVDAIHGAGLDPHRLELELTESLLLEDAEQVRDSMRQLKSLGVRFALDDFGTGYSNLSSLRQFPLDRLKIDQSFVRHIGRDAAEAQIARSIIDIGHARGLQVIAEGIEDEATAELLRGAHCDQAQGYLFSRPLPADAFADWMRARG